MSEFPRCKTLMSPRKPTKLSMPWATSLGSSPAARLPPLPAIRFEDLGIWDVDLPVALDTLV